MDGRDQIRHSWWHMNDRCINSENKSYKWYGGRGIKVCERWLDLTKVSQKGKGRPSPQGFLNFLEDMGATWFPGASIDRIDNDGDYTPENCQWLSRSENASKENQERVENGIHHLLGGSIQRTSNENRVKNGTHNFQKDKNGVSFSANRVKDGTHPFLKKVICVHCNKSISPSNHTRWHGDKCKMNLQELHHSGEFCG